MTIASRARPDLGRDDRLLGRLRQLSLVELDALLVGAPADRRAALVDAYADDVSDALLRARERMRELVDEIARGPDPLALVDAPGEAVASGGAADAARASSARLADRAERCRELARFDEATGQLLGRLFEVVRRRGR